VSPKLGVNGAPNFMNLFAGAPEKWASEVVELILIQNGGFKL
jgi:hypothetical protein